MLRHARASLKFRSLLKYSLLLACAASTSLAAGAGPRVLPEGSLPNDKRLAPLKDLDGYFPLEVPATKEAWERRAEVVRRQTKVALGLWPLPTKTPLNAVVHGKVERDGYTVERVYLESFPGHFVTGSLYRPTGRRGKLPGVLCPHGHWANGRFFDHGLDEVKKQIAAGAEKYEVGGRYPLQARCMHLARMGCVVFHYDMVGYADSQQISFDVAHRYSTPRPELDGSENWGFFSTQAELRLQTIMGLQTYNSIRALDWISELPDVDPSRIGVTGASGGGTQTFALCAVDPRPAAAFPAVMVSTAMQGGCTCENCNYLRVETGNIELAGLFAPKPLCMSAADDWTKEMETKGFPELARLYRVLGAEDHVGLRAYLQFGHNYNYVSRAAMYDWFNKFLKLGHETTPVEQDFKPLSIAELTVWDDQHPKPPSGEAEERRLLRAISADADAQISALEPKDTSSLAEYQRVVGGAFDVLIGRGLSEAGAVTFDDAVEVDKGDYIQFTGLLRYAAKGEEAPGLFLHPKNWNKQVVIWVDGAGKSGLFQTSGELQPEVSRLIQAGTAVGALDLLYQGEFLKDGQPLEQTPKVENPREFAGFTLGYNHPVFAQRVHDILSMISLVKHHEQQPIAIHLVGVHGAGPLAAAAAAQAHGVLSKVAIDTGSFRFAHAKNYRDPDFLPGAVKYGDLPGLLALAVPCTLWISGEGATPSVVQAAYKSANRPEQVVSVSPAAQQESAAAVDWLLK